MTDVGIVGCGFIGGALRQWLQEHNPSIKYMSQIRQRAIMTVWQSVM